MGPNLPHQHPDHQAVQPQPQPQQQPGQKSYSQSYHQSQRQPSENHLNLHGSSRPDHRSPHYSRRSESRAIDDDDDEEDDGEVKGNHLMQDGSLNKKEGQQDNSSEMHKCLDCGKIYKHPNCLWKHRWLHSVYWKGATKFLLSKHQQVQLMEAAAILLGMDESRQGDKDPIVSMFSKQRGALANSIGSSLSTSSSSGSPPTSTKSLSASPPPMSHQTKANDIQMLNALRNESVSIKVESLTPLKTTATATTSSMSSATTSPTNAKSATSLNPSSSSSTPPNLAPDDDSLPDPDDDLVVISPPSHRGSVISSAPVHMTVNGPPSVVVEMDLGMDVDHKPLHSKRGLEHKQQQLHMQHDGYRY
ncbi:hypothetical protein BGZ46_006521 [Entomortierella lignicola]|nr:hypothetical protein BGZ46_006521 [Entomortierella lignicola]